MSISGCPVPLTDNNSTSECEAGTRITITGANFTATQLSVYLVSPSYPCTDLQRVSSEVLTCILPIMSSSERGQTYPVVVVGGGALSQQVLIQFGSHVPVVWGASGCAYDNLTSNSTSGCVAGQLITLYGDRFLENSTTVSFNLPSNFQPCSSVHVTSRTQLTCMLPTVWSQYWETPLSLYAIRDYQLYSDTTRPLIRYAWLGPYIQAVSGCASSVDGNSTVDCNGGDVVTIFGRGFVPSNLTVQVRYRDCTNITFLDSSTLVVTLPYLPVAAPSMQAVYVSYHNISYYSGSNTPNLIGYSSQTPLVRSVSGCAVDSGNSTESCVAGQKVTVQGGHFLNGSLFVVVAGLNCTSVQLVSSTLLTCDLPTVSADDMERPLMLQVSSSSMLSAAPPLVTFSYLGPYIQQVRGCSSGPGNGTSGCSGGDVVTVSGKNFSSSPTHLAVYVAGSVCTNLQVVAPGSIICSLPFLSSSGGLVDLHVYSDGEFSQTAHLISYTSQQPIVWRVVGCSMDNSTDNSTSGCAGGERLTVMGVQFLQVQAVYVGSYMCSSVTVLSTTVLTCTAPAQLFADQGVALNVLVYSSRMWSPSAYVSVYAYLGPVINSMYGCSNGTSGCNGLDQLTVVGSGFSSCLAPIITLSTWGQSYRSVVAQKLDSSKIVALLPLVPTSVVATFSLLLQCNGLPDSQAAELVSYNSQVPTVYAVRGCSVDHPESNSTSGCEAGMQVTITGSLFLLASPAPVVLISGIPCPEVGFVSAEIVWAVLPTVPDSLPGVDLDVQVRIEGLYSNTPRLVEYNHTGSVTVSSSSSSSSLSSSGSTGAAAARVADGDRESIVVAVGTLLVVLPVSLLLVLLLLCARRYGVTSFAVRCWPSRRSTVNRGQLIAKLIPAAGSSTTSQQPRPRWPLRSQSETM